MHWLDTAEEKICKPEDVEVGNIQDKTQREKWPSSPKKQHPGINLKWSNIYAVTVPKGTVKYLKL